jgi:hypothetical protein
MAALSDEAWGARDDDAPPSALAAFLLGASLGLLLWLVLGLAVWLLLNWPFRG